jgi:DNA-binding transcriptional ArsR family regulator
VVAAVLRVHLTAADLMRVRLSPGPAPMIELSLGVAGIQRREPSPAVLAWHAGLDRRLPRQSRALFDLIRPTGGGPLFLDPPCPSFAEGMDRVQSTSSEEIAADLRLAHGPQGRPVPWVRDLARRDPDATRLLVAALDGAHRVLVADQWARIQAGVNADLAWRRRLLADYGVRALLDSLYPSAWWQDLVLHLPSGGDLDVRLDGTGLTLQPVANWTGGPLAGYDAYGSLLLVYRAARPIPLLEAAGSDGSPLAALLGRTRGSVLSLLTEQYTTSQVAAELGISVASASEHTKALRDAGLVVTIRAGKAVNHTATTLGLRLLESVTGPQCPADQRADR